MDPRQGGDGFIIVISQIKLFIFDLMIPLEYINASVVFMLSPI